MKKAKLMLVTLLVFVIAVAAQASKAKFYSTHFIYVGALNSGSCTIKVNGAGISNGTPNFAADVVPLASGCSNRYVDTTIGN
jgi:hypothetical protein